jgi:Uma2 family endonuclease
MGTPLKDEKYSYKDYLTWDDKLRYEAFDGKVYAMSPAPTPKHQSVLTELMVEFGAFLRGKQCRVFSSPIDVCLFSDKDTSDEDIKDWVQPDLAVVCNPDKIGDKRITGAPDLIVEILSPSTAKVDRVLKYSKYEQAGVREYWIVDPLHETVEVFLLEDSSYIRGGVYTKDEEIPVSIFEDFFVNLSHVFY